MKHNKLWLIAPALLLLAPSCSSGPMTLNDCSWATIKRLSNQGIAREYFDIGDTKDIMVNGIKQQVRIIGFDQDVNRAGKKLGITFEFVNLLSDKDGYSLAAYWDDVSNAFFIDYRESTLRAVLNGKSETGSQQDINWFEKDSASFSTDYAGKSVLSMLPKDLVNVLATPSKWTNTSEGEQQINDKLFLLSPREMGFDGDYQEESTTTYLYYDGHTDQVDPIRIKHQIKNEDGALTSPTSVNDGQYGGMKSSYAGLDLNDVDSTLGSPYWLRSPYMPFTSSAWFIDNNGMAFNSDLFKQPNNAALPIAPAFCI